MSDNVPVVITLVTAIGSGLVGGVFFAFSTVVMKALAQLPPAQGIAAMQAINRAAPAPLFMLALFGTGLGCAALIVNPLLAWGERGSTAHLVGGALYLVGVVAITIGYHIPRNDALARFDPNDAGARTEWSRYLSEWTIGNHVRTVAALAAAVNLTIALMLRQE